MGKPVLVIEEVLKHLDAVPADQEEVKIFVPEVMVHGNKPVPHDVGMAMLLDKLLGMGFSPIAPTALGQGKVYRYKRSF
jgi:hypothetical protein